MLNHLKKNVRFIIQSINQSLDKQLNLILGSSEVWKVMTALWSNNKEDFAATLRRTRPQTSELRRQKSFSQLIIADGNGCLIPLQELNEPDLI